MSSMLKGIELCKKKKHPPSTALAFVALLMCGKEVSSDQDLFNFCDKWIQEFGNPTYRKIVKYTKELGYIREIAEIALSLKEKDEFY